MPTSIRQYFPDRSVILIATAVAFSLLGDQALYAVLPIHFKTLGLFPYQVGILLSLNRWIRLITNHLAERMSAYFSTKWVIFIVLIARGIPTALLGYVSTWSGSTARAVLPTDETVCVIASGFG